MERACRRKSRETKSQQTHQVNASISDDEEYSMYTISNRTTKPFKVTLKVNGDDTTMEVDTGAWVSIVSEEQFKVLKENGSCLRHSKAKLLT